MIRAQYETHVPYDYLVGRILYACDIVLLCARALRSGPGIL